MRTIIYKRVSTDDQADRGYSLQHQEDVIKQFCKLHNYPILDVYTEDCSGKNFDRPEWNKILKFLKKNLLSSGESRFRIVTVLIRGCYCRSVLGKLYP